MRALTIAGAVAFSLIAHTAAAESATVDVSVADAKCTVGSGPAGEYEIRFRRSATDAAEVSAQHVRVNNTDTRTIVLGSIATSFEIKFDTDTQKDVKVACDAPAKLTSPQPLAFSRFDGGGEPRPHPGPPNEDSDGFEGAGAALAWLTQHEKISAHTFRDGVWTLYHLPDGRPAFPLPAHVTEHQRVRLAVVLPKGATARFGVDACGGVPTFRAEGSFRHALRESGRKDAADSFTVLDHTTDLTCADNLTYTVEVKEHGTVASTRSSLVIDSVQRFFVGAGVMFDFVSPERLSLNDRPSATGGSEKYIELADHFAGFRPLITAGVYPCEANPHDWKVCNMFAPVIAVDVTRIDQGAGLGLQFMPVHGLGIVGGFDVYLSEHLPEKVSAKPGDTWSVPGDLPVDERFDLDSLGGFVGVVCTLDVIASIFH